MLAPRKISVTLDHDVPGMGRAGERIEIQLQYKDMPAWRQMTRLDMVAVVVIGFWLCVLLWRSL